MSSIVSIEIVNSQKSKSFVVYMERWLNREDLTNTNLTKNSKEINFNIF